MQTLVYSMLHISPPPRSLPLVDCVPRLPLPTANLNAGDSIVQGPISMPHVMGWLTRFNAVWGHLGQYDRVTQLFLAERRDVYGRALAPYDLGVSGPIHPVTQYIAMRPGDDVFARFMADTLHWPDALFCLLRLLS